MKQKLTGNSQETETEVNWAKKKGKNMPEQTFQRMAMYTKAYK